MNLKKRLRPIIGEWADTKIANEFTKQYMIGLQNFLKKERQKYTVYPPKDQVFRALRLTPPDNVKICILGQDPYHDGSANGLAFSNGGNYQNISPSLRNIFKEIERDIGFEDVAPNPDLTRWAEQGVLLLNTTLTVRKGESGSHSKIQGMKIWQKFTKKVLHYLSKKDKFIVFMLWGNHAKEFMKDYPLTIDPFGKNEILHASHPSPFSAHISFHGCGHFSKANEFLKKHELDPIDW